MYCICQCGAMDSKVHTGQKRPAVSNCKHLVSVFSSLDIFRSLLNCFKYQCYHCSPSPQETIYSPTCYFPLIFLTPSCKNSSYKTLFYTESRSLLSMPSFFSFVLQITTCVFCHVFYAFCFLSYWNPFIHILSTYMMWIVFFPIDQIPTVEKSTLLHLVVSQTFCLLIKIWENKSRQIYSDNHLHRFQLKVYELQCCRPGVRLKYDSKQNTREKFLMLCHPESWKSVMGRWPGQSFQGMSSGTYFFKESPISPGCGGTRL